MCQPGSGDCGGRGGWRRNCTGGRDRAIALKATQKFRSSFLLLMHKNMTRNCRLQSSLRGLWVAEEPRPQDGSQASSLGRRGPGIQYPF